MHIRHITSPGTDDFGSQVSRFLLKWTPRVLVAALAGYYCLGVAYSWGVMAAIDRVAISALRSTVGYAGVGAAMPTFQWYSAWGVRSVVALGAGVLYDLTERIVLYIYHRIHDYFYPPEQPPATAGQAPVHVPVGVRV